MKNRNEPRLCRDCPLTDQFKELVYKRLLREQWTRQKSEPSTHRECLERRRELKYLGLNCPYFPASESLTVWCSP